MVLIDYIFILLALMGSLAIGALYSTKMTDSKVMFVAGKTSSWWVSGVSGYMTAFSAGTFVVWGGIAFRQGMVAVSILMLMGVSLMFIGLFIAGRWRKMGVNSPAEYLGLRYGSTTVSLYTVIGFIGRGISVAVALYSIAIIVAALIPLPESSFLVDPETGKLSVTWAVLIIGATTIFYTVAGGLWAVLMTDMIQFIILSLMVLIMVPLSLKSVGGVDGFLEKIPDGFLSLAGGKYTFIWLMIWFASNFFLEGGDFAFVQRYICVPDEKSAKKAAFLMGGLYLVSPILWMLPALVYRTVDPSANPEQAYILAGQKLLPAGLLGLMVAAMFSATASMVSGMLNVFAGVITHDIYRPQFDPNASEKKLVFVGRIITLVFGVSVLILAIMIPNLGGAERVVVTLVTLMIGPLGIPAVWGIFSKHINQKEIWITLGTTYILGFSIKLGFATNGPLTNLWEGGASVAAFVKENKELIDGLIGVVLPLCILPILELRARSRGIYDGWIKLTRFIEQNKLEEAATVHTASLLPNKILIWASLSLGLALGWVGLADFNREKVVLLFAILLLAIPAIMWIRNLIVKNRK